MVVSGVYLLHKWVTVFSFSFTLSYYIVLHYCHSICPHTAWSRVSTTFVFLIFTPSFFFLSRCLSFYLSLSLSDEIHFLSSTHHYPSVMLSLHHLSLEPSFPQGLFSVHYHPHGIHSVANLHSACSYSLLIFTLMQMHTHTYMLNSELWVH